MKRTKEEQIELDELIKEQYKDKYQIIKHKDISKKKFKTTNKKIKRD